MFVEVVPARYEGVPLPRWQWGAKLQRGKLEVTEDHDPERSRIVRTARLTSILGEDLLLPLRDAALIAIVGETMTLTGYEATQAIRQFRYCQQSWIVRLSSRDEVERHEADERARRGG